jgi:hypothetical protein
VLPRHAFYLKRAFRSVKKCQEKGARLTKLYKALANSLRRGRWNIHHNTERAVEREIKASQTIGWRRSLMIESQAHERSGSSLLIYADGL